MRWRAALLLLLAAVAALWLLGGELGRVREPGTSRAAALDPVDAKLASAPPEDEAPDASATSSLGGEVRDERGQRLAGARVRLFRDSGEPDRWRDGFPDDALSTVATDEQGRFLIEASPEVSWILVADLDGYLPAVQLVRKGIETAEYAMTLARGDVQRLRVTDEQGRPVALADALVFQRDETLRATAKADADGRIEFLAAPRDLVVVRAPGFTWELLEAPLAEPEIALEREYRIGGVVETAAGVPLKDVVLSFDRYLWSDQAVTADDGSFLVGGFGEGDVELLVSPPGREWQSETVQPGDERLRIVVPTARIEGVVLLPGGRPASGAWVGAGTRCDDSGRFAFDGVLPGDRDMYASLRAPGSRLEGRVRVAVAADGVTGVRIPLEPAPLSFVRVSVVGPDGPPHEFTVRGRVQGQYCSAWFPEGPGLGILDIDVVPGTEVQLHGWASGLSGTARAVTSASREAARVTLRLQPPEPPAPPILVTVVCREADGSALPEDVKTRVYFQRVWAKELPSDGPGRHRFQVRAEAEEARITAGAPGYLPREISEWTPSSEVEIRLERAVRIIGSAAPDVAISLSSHWGSSNFDPSGRFWIDAAPGDRVVIAARRGRVPGFVRTVDVPAQGPVNLGEIRPGTPWVLRGRVTDDGGAPVGGASVFVRGPAYEGKCLTRGDGTFQIEAPPSDLYNVEAEKGSLASDPAPASAFLGGSQVLRLR